MVKLIRLSVISEADFSVHILGKERKSSEKRDLEIYPCATPTEKSAPVGNRKGESQIIAPLLESPGPAVG